MQAGLVETQHADALRTLGDLAAARSYAQQSVDAAAHSHTRGRVHRLATLATILAGQGDAERRRRDRGTMLDQAAGMESRRITERIVQVRDAVAGMSDSRAATELAERVADITGVRLRRRLAPWNTGAHALDGPLREAAVRRRVARHPDSGRRAARRPAPRAPADPHAARRRLRHRRDGQALLLWRHRFITGTQGWEIPIGKIEPGEEPAEAAARETEEEPAGGRGRCSSCSARSRARHVRLGAPHLPRRRGRAIGPPEDDFESDRVAWVPLADVPWLIGRGDITSGTTLAALLYTIACESAAG